MGTPLESQGRVTSSVKDRKRVGEENVWLMKLSDENTQVCGDDRFQVLDKNLSSIWQYEDMNADDDGMMDVKERESDMVIYNRTENLTAGLGSFQ